MSEQGDVVWADGRSWQKDHMFSTSPKRYWINPDKSATLKELKAFKDFTWLVKNGDLYYGKSKPVKHDERLTDAVQLTLWDVFSMDETDEVILRGCE